MIFFTTTKLIIFTDYGYYAVLPSLTGKDVHSKSFSEENSHYVNPNKKQFRRRRQTPHP